MLCICFQKHNLKVFVCLRDPNGNSPTASPSEPSAGPKSAPLEDGTHAPFWDTYDTINQLYLELGKYFKINLSELKSTLTQLNLELENLYI